MSTLGSCGLAVRIAPDAFARSLVSVEATPQMLRRLFRGLRLLTPCPSACVPVFIDEDKTVRYGESRVAHRIGEVRPC